MNLLYFLNNATKLQYNLHCIIYLFQTSDQYMLMNTLILQKRKKEVFWLLLITPTWYYPVVCEGELFCHLYFTLSWQEFESYHLVKFNRGPKIIKKKVTSGEEISWFINLIAQWPSHPRKSSLPQPILILLHTCSLVPRWCIGLTYNYLER